MSTLAAKALVSFVLAYGQRCMVLHEPEWRYGSNQREGVAIEQCRKADWLAHLAHSWTISEHLCAQILRTGHTNPTTIATRTLSQFSKHTCRSQQRATTGMCSTYPHHSWYT